MLEVLKSPRQGTLLLPKFKLCEITDDLSGMAQHYYDAYLKDGDRYELSDGLGLDALHVKVGVALRIVGIGKVAPALSLMRIITNPRFDFSGAYVISTDCACLTVETTVMGNVFIVKSARQTRSFFLDRVATRHCQDVL